jgi:hypothetical protein
MPPKKSRPPPKDRSAPPVPSIQQAPTEDLIPLLPPLVPQLPPWTPTKIARSKLKTTATNDICNVAAASSTREYKERYDSDSDIDYNDILDGIDDDSDYEFNTSFPKDNKQSNLRVLGGVNCPDVSLMTEEEGNSVIKQWRKERKAFTDKRLKEAAMADRDARQYELDDAPNTGDTTTSIGTM